MKPGLLVRGAGAVEDDRAAAVAVAGLAGAVGEGAAVVAVAVVAEAGIVTAAIAAVAGTAAGKHVQQFKFVREPGSIMAPRFYFSGCQGTFCGLCFP